MSDKIKLTFELGNGLYTLIDKDEIINNITFTADELIEDKHALDTQSKLEYIFYRKRNNYKGGTGK